MTEWKSNNSKNIVVNRPICSFILRYIFLEQTLYKIDNKKIQMHNKNKLRKPLQKTKLQILTNTKNIRNSLF